MRFTRARLPCASIPNPLYFLGLIAEAIAEFFSDAAGFFEDMGEAIGEAFIAFGEVSTVVGP